MAIMMVLCFTFVGVSSLWAGSIKDLHTKNGKLFKVYLDDNGKIIKGELDDQEVQPQNINTLSIKVQGDKETYDFKSLPPGTVIYTGPGDTCIWYFDGSKYVKRCF